MHFFIGIDDTDNLETRGTGYRARQLSELIAYEKCGNVIGATRHQLYVHEDVPYTSHNSSACIEVENGDREQLIAVSRKFLISIAAVGSDVGLCVAEKKQISDEIIQWGLRAKREVLTMDEAYKIAENNGIHLEGLSGLHTGIIGSMAGVGLRLTGNDGRYIWLPGKDFREIQGIMSKEQLLKQSMAKRVIDLETKIDIPLNSVINTGEWTRPIILNSEPVIVVSKSDSDSNIWLCPPKEILKKLSD